MNATTKILTKDAVLKLERIGFSTYEAKIFFVLYQGLRMSATEIAKEARIPRPSVYSILRSFAEKGFCNEIDTPSKQYYEMIESKVIEDKIEDDINSEHKDKIVKLKDCFSDIRPVFKSKRPSEYKNDVELIRGYNRLRDQKFLELVKNSHKGILVMNRFKGFISAELDNESKNFYKRGGKVKSIYESSTDFRIKINNKWENVSHDGLVKICEEFAKHGEEIKLLKDVPQIMAVFDEETVYFSLFDENIPIREMTDVIIKNRRFAKFITELFHLYWNKSIDLKEFKSLFNNKLN